MSASFKTAPSSTQQALNYDEYHLSCSEYGTLLLRAVAVNALFAFVFYRSVLFFLLFLPLAALYPLYKKRELIPARKRRLLLQFREGLSVLSASLSAGYSIENALKESVDELSLLYDRSELIVREFDQLSHLVSMNMPVERAMDEFAERSGIDDIRNFARVLRIAKRSGGELVAIMNHSAETIGDRIQVKEELRTMTASRRFEQSIMNAVPLLIVLYINLSSPGFFSIMYTSVLGRCVMTVCLAAYLFSIHLAWSILNIEL